jgi:hypothetical protein
MTVELGYGFGGDYVDVARAGFLGASISVPYTPATPYVSYRHHVGEYVDTYPSNTSLPFEYRVLFVGIELWGRLRVEYFDGNSPVDSGVGFDERGFNIVYSMPFYQWKSILGP